MARPRLHPRRASQSTAGSSANDANRAMSTHVNRVVSWRSRVVAADATSHAAKITASSVTIQRHDGGWIHTGIGRRSCGGARRPTELALRRRGALVRLAHPPPSGAPTLPRARRGGYPRDAVIEASGQSATEAERRRPLDCMHASSVITTPATAGCTCRSCRSRRGTDAGVNARGERKPPWLKVRLRNGPNATELKDLMRGLDLHTVCEEAMCPNIHECWEDREATFLILGDRCTRRCGFCDVMTAKPDHVDADEPARIAEAVARMGLRFVVLTGVARDDLADGGARDLGRDRASRETRRCPAPGSRCCRATSRAGNATSRRCSRRSPTSSPTTSRPFAGSTAASGRRSGTTDRSRCCGSRSGCDPARSRSRT